ncbi:hypothetical protein TWF569_002565 [Orbilia oligospora]|nr:hypothetical protein TWF569_002565 [Orbilia oligospora]
MPFHAVNPASSLPWTISARFGKRSRLATSLHGSHEQFACKRAATKRLNWKLKEFLKAEDWNKRRIVLRSNQTVAIAQNSS